MADFEKREYAVFSNELDELAGLYKDSAGELVNKIEKRGELGDALWRKANPWDGDLGGFLANEVQSIRNSLPPGFLRLRQGLWGSTRETKTIYLRDWYIQTATEIISSRGEQWIEQSPWIVAGSSGMGKSVFGFVLLLQALYAGLNVAYQRGTKRFWIVADRKPQDYDDMDDFEVLEEFHRYGYSEAIAPGVYRVKSVSFSLFDRLSELPKVLRIVDMDDSVLDCEVNTLGCKVIISSPNSNSKLMRESSRIGDGSRHKCMPCWTLEELKTLNEKLPEGDTTVVVPKPIHRKLPAEVLKELYERFGGVPQVIFKNESVGKKYRTLQETIQETPLEVIRTALNSHSYSGLSSAFPSLLLHIKQDPNGGPVEGDCRVEFVSDFVMSAVADYHGLESAEKSFFSLSGKEEEMRVAPPASCPEDKNVQL